MKYVVLGVVLVAIVYFVFPNGTPLNDSIQIGGSTYSVIHANTDELRMKGLSGRDGLPRDTVMLFSFPIAGKYGFWMKDMKFPIDILWTNDIGDSVQYIEREISPDTYPKAFYPPKNSLYVIEGKAGQFEDIQVGDLVKIK